MRGALGVALGAGGLGALVALLVMQGAPTWIWVTLVVFVLLATAMIVGAVLLRDPEARLRRFVLRTALFFGMGAVAKATMGFTIDTDGSVQLGTVLGTRWSMIIGNAWWVDLICLVGGFAMIALVVVRATPREPHHEPLRPAVADASAATAEEAPASTLHAAEVFRERARQLFEKRAFTSFALPDYSVEHGCLFGECRDAGGTRRAVVRCDDRDVDVTVADLEAVEGFAARLPDGAEARVYYATPGLRAVEAALAARFPRVECVSESKLLDTVVHFDGYLRRVIERYEHDELPYSTASEKHTLAGTFVPPHYALHGAAGEPPRAQLSDYLDDWLHDAKPRQIALLADYGMGKSSFLKHYAAHLARRRLDGSSARIPVLLSLTGRSPRNHPGVQGLVQAFIDQYQLRCEYAAFELLMKAGRLVFLVDAFDEMDLVGDRTMRLAHFAELWRLHMPGNKLLFAGRPTFFPDDAELREALHIAALGPERMAHRGYCERISLAPLRDPDIEKSFVAYFPPGEGQRHYDWVKANPRLLELARRPAMMHIIRDTIEDLRKGGADSIALREAALLKGYTNHWIDRQIEGGEPARGVDSRAKAPRRQLLVSPDLRARFSENLAVWMFANERASVKSAELSALFAQWFPEETARVGSGNAGASIEHSHLVEGIATDLRNCTFLIGDHEGNFVFAHKPFYEYFVAASIDRALRDQRPLPDEVQSRRWGVEIALHVADLWLLRREGAPPAFGEVRRVFRVIARPSWGAAFKLLVPWARRVRPAESASNPRRPRSPSRVRGAWRVLRVIAAGLPSPLGFSSLYADVVSGQRWNALQVLLRTGVQFDWIQHNLFSTVLRRLGSIEHSARCLETLELARARFDGALLEDIDLSERSLAGASFAAAKVRRCRFAGSDLADVDLVNSELDEVSFIGAKLHRSSFQGARMLGCRFDRADAQAARFIGASINGSMRLASLRGASFRDAELMANMSGVDATGAIDLDLPVPPIETAPVTLGPVDAVSWSPNDDMLLVVSRGSAWVLSAGTGTLIRRIVAPSGAIVAAQFSSPTSIVVATAAGALETHDLVTCTVRTCARVSESRPLAFDESAAFCAAIGGDGATVIVTPCDDDDNNNIRGRWTATVPGKITQVHVGEGGDFVVVSCARKESWVEHPGIWLHRVYLVLRGGASWAITEHLGPEPCLHLHGLLLAISLDSAVGIYRLGDVRVGSPTTANAHESVSPWASVPGRARAFTFSRDGAWLFTEGEFYLAKWELSLTKWFSKTWKLSGEVASSPSGVIRMAAAHNCDELALCTGAVLSVLDVKRMVPPYVHLILHS